MYVVGANILYFYKKDKSLRKQGERTIYTLEVWIKNLEYQVINRRTSSLKGSLPTSLAYSNSIFLQNLLQYRCRVSFS
jgi:hypothetical protein